MQSRQESLDVASPGHRCICYSDVVAPTVTGSGQFWVEQNVLIFLSKPIVYGTSNNIEKMK